MKNKIPLIGLVANVVLAVTKVVIGLLSKSSAILADGIHSTTDIFSSAISYLGIKISEKPADEKHPYGHYKAEVIAGFIITIIVFLTALGIIYSSIKSLLKPEIIIVNYLSVGVMLFSAVLNEIMARLKIKYGKLYNSISLISDGVHSRVDTLTSIGVLIGLFVSKYFAQADSIIAILIGFYILKEAISLGKEAVDSLLDSSAGKDVEEKIKSILSEQKIELSSLKTQKRGSVITANLEIKLPSNLSVDEATKISERLRQTLMSELKNLKYVSIQIKSHNVSTDFYKNDFGVGFGWWHGLRGSRGFGKRLGPADYCVCPKCGYRVKHERGVPCNSLTCPKCGAKLVRG